MIPSVIKKTISFFSCPVSCPDLRWPDVFVIALLIEAVPSVKKDNASFTGMIFFYIKKLPCNFSCIKKNIYFFNQCFILLTKLSGLWSSWATNLTVPALVSKLFFTFLIRLSCEQMVLQFYFWESLHLRDIYCRFKTKESDALRIRTSVLMMKSCLIC